MCMRDLRGASLIDRAIDVPTTDPHVSWMSEIRKISGLILRNGWPDCYQERNAFIPHCMSTITEGCCGKLLPGAEEAWPR